MAEQPTTNEHAYTVRKAPPRKEHPDRVAEREKVPVLRSESTGLIWQFLLY